MTNPKSMNLSPTDESVLTFNHASRSGHFSDNAILGTKLFERIKQRLTTDNLRWMLPDEGELLMDQGLPCKRLVPGSTGWVSGKLKLTIEFVPDAPEPVTDTVSPDPSSSPLDTIRQEITSS